tara:strand:+ start:312 stop:1352 length:1041 start_codon:yes stop_codon:yes gene_type:complete
MKRRIVNFIINKLFDSPISRSKNYNKLFFKRFPILSINNFKKNSLKFYVIRVKKAGGGLFSNVLYVLNHIKIANKINLIPVVDMQNFYTIYNQYNKINNTSNSWEYYFEPITKYSIEEVYRSGKLIYSDPDISLPRNFIDKKNYKKLFKKNIKIKKNFFLFVNHFVKKNFKNKKVIGIHLRGTDMKHTPNHPLPPTLSQVFNIIDILIKKKKFNKIFLVTDQKKYLEKFKNKYEDKVCFINCFRSNKDKIFNLNIRKNHRYKLGKESLEQMLLLSKMSYLISSKSNLSRCAVLYSKKPIKCIEIDNGMNSSRIIYARFKWYIKKILPSKLGGFKEKIKVNFKTLNY